MISGVLMAVFWVMFLVVWQIANNVSEEPAASIFSISFPLLATVILSLVIRRRNRQSTSLAQHSNAALFYRHVLEPLLLV
jgi:hypothetical protein